MAPIKSELANNLTDLLDSGILNAEENRLARESNRMANRALEVGVNPDQALPRENAFFKILDYLDTPRQALAGVIDSVVRGDIFTPKVGLGIQRGMQENTSTSDILKHANVLSDSPVTRGVLGFAGDVLTDPLSYLSFGATGVAKAGGRALTESGLALKTTAESRLLSKGLTSLDTSAKVDDAFRGLSLYQEGLKEFQKAGNSNALKDIALSKMKNAEDMYKGVFDSADLANQNISNIFEKPGITISKDIPFLGYFSKGDKQASFELKNPGEQLGLVSQGLDLLSNTLKIKKVKFAKLDFSDDTLQAIANINDAAASALNRVKYAAEAVPIVGPGVRKVADSVGDLYKGFLRTFARRTIIGRNANDLVLEQQNAVAAAKALAVDEVYRTLGETALADKNLMQQAYLIIDGFASGGLNKKIADVEKTSQQLAAAGYDVTAIKKDLEQAAEHIKYVRGGTENTSEARKFFAEFSQKYGLEGGFRSELNNWLAQANRPGEQPLKQLVQNVVGKMDEISMKEAEAGIPSGFLEYYITHKYQNIDTVKNAIGGDAKGFLKPRTFNTISDAFNTEGLSAETQLSEILRKRIEGSYTQLANRRFANRLFLQEGFKESDIKNLYQEALADPNGPAAQALAKKGLDLADPQIQARIGNYIRGEKTSALQGELSQFIKNPEADLAKIQELQKFNELTDTQLWSAGFKPKDNHDPRFLLGEIGTKIKSGNDEFYLPKEIARAYNEVVSNKDYVREMVKDSTAAKTFVDAIDSISNTLKKSATVFFPAYWGQNFLGDRYRQLMQGASAMDPGLYMRVYNTMIGKGLIRSKGGVTLDGDTIRKAAKEMGLEFSPNDFLGTIRNFSETTPEYYKGFKDSAAKNLAQGDYGVLYDKAMNNLQYSFDGFHRLTHFIHRFEQGDTIPEAVRAAQEAYFNYRDMTQFEKSFFRRFYFFYGYMSKATKSSLNDLFLNPGNITQQLSATRALGNIFAGDIQTQDMDSLQRRLLDTTTTAEQITTPIGRTAEGKLLRASNLAAPINAVLNQFSLQMPRAFSIKEIIGASEDSLQRTLQKQLASSQPLINTAMQFITNRNFYFDKSLDERFLRKLPSLNAAAEKLTGLSYNELPLDLDAPVKKFLNAVPDGKGNLVAEPTKFLLLMNLIPALGRVLSTAAQVSNADTDLKANLLRLTTGIRTEDTDVTRTYLKSQQENLKNLFQTQSIYLRENANDNAS